MKNIHYFTATKFIALLLLFLSSNHAFSDESDTINLGLVKSGAFLLSENPDTLRDGLSVHSLIGYLPTGTRVIIENEKIVTNLSTADNETYYFVKSEIGLSGLLRDDLLVKSNGRRLAVSIASFEIQIHQPNATLTNPRKRFKIGRHGGHYFEVTGETEKGFYDVVLHRGNPDPPKLPATEKARLKKVYVKKRLVSFLDPSDAALLSEFNKSWNTAVNINDGYFNTLLTTVKEKMGEENLTKIKNTLGDINNLQCLIEASADGEFGFKVFSNGFSVKLEAAMKEAGVKYLFDVKKLSLGNSSKYYSGISAIKCEGMKPLRLHQFTVQEDIVSTQKRFEIRLSDLKNINSKWINTLQSTDISTKMVRISGWEQYNKLIKVLNNYAISGQGYLSTLPEKTRLVLLNYIVSRISHFEHRDHIIQRDTDNT